MRYLFPLLMAAAAFGQAPASQAPAAKPEEKAAQAPAKADEAAAPAPASESSAPGDLFVGYRARTDVLGSMETYRSVVDLREGLRLFGLSFTIQDPKKRLFDRLDARGFNWGDPYNTAHVDVTKRGIYNLRFDYRNILNFNALPSYANPAAPGGYNEQSLDVRRKNASFDLELMPGRRVVPYLAYDHNSGSGTGVSTWVQGGFANDYAVPTRFRDGTENYRGGLRFELSRFHVTLEQGGTTFKDDQSVYDSVTRTGDRPGQLFGQTLLLTGLQQAYAIRGHSMYSKVLATATPFSWLTLSGQFLFSQPKTDVNYVDAARGNFAVVSSLLFYSGQAATVTGAANKPHVSGNAGFELRPFRRLRIVESWTTDRFHDAAYSTIADYLLASGPPLAATATILPDRQVVNYNQTQTDLFFDLTSKISLRGGYRYVWGDATVRTGPLNPIGPLETGKLNRQVGIAGFNIRPIQKLSVNAEYEGGSTTHAYFRASLYNYHRLRARARFQAAANLSVQAGFSLLDNQNPSAGIQYDFRSRDNTVSLNWTPAGGKWITVLAEYDRATLRSSINYLIPPFLAPGVSAYRDNAHLATSAIEASVPGLHGFVPKVTMGGSLTVVNGTRPSRFYQPMGRLALPIGKHASWNTEWQWYGFNEAQFLYEGFRTHLFQTGLKLTK